MTDLTLIQKIVIWALPVIFAITLHEVAHGWVASKLGDQTARLAGRLTLNPAKHIDLVGTILLPLILLVTGGFIFGWAKPVPVDYRNLSHPRRDAALVAAAGPISNLLMAVFWAGIAKLGLSANLWFGLPMVYMGEAGIMINLVLGVLNLLPLPPLDGGRVLMNLLPGPLGWKLSRIEPYGFFILILLLISGVLSYIMAPPIIFLRNAILSLFGLM